MILMRPKLIKAFNLCASLVGCIVGRRARPNLTGGSSDRAIALSPRAHVPPWARRELRPQTAGRKQSHGASARPEIPARPRRTEIRTTPVRRAETPAAIEARDACSGRARRDKAPAVASHRDRRSSFPTRRPGVGTGPAGARASMRIVPRPLTLGPQACLHSPSCLPP